MSLLLHFNKLSYRCADGALGMPRTRVAAQQLTPVAQPLQGPLASARSCVSLRSRPIAIGIGHLRSRPFAGVPSTNASAGCWRLRRRIRDALLSFACPCRPSLIRRLEVSCASEKRANTKNQSISSQPQVSCTQRRRVRGGPLPATTAPSPAIAGVIYFRSKATHL